MTTPAVRPLARVCARLPSMRTDSSWRRSTSSCAGAARSSGIRQSGQRRLPVRAAPRGCGAAAAGARLRREDHGPRRRALPRRARAAAPRARARVWRRGARADTSLNALRDVRPHVRVIAGRLGGRRLRAPRGDRTRPTAEAVREALFSMLVDVDGAEVLDLFAGSGALGIEALSRGARRAVFVERNAASYAALRANLRTLELGRGEALARHAEARAGIRTARTRGETYDLVFIDPPYRQAQDWADVLQTSLPGLLERGGTRGARERSAVAAGPGSAAGAGTTLWRHTHHHPSPSMSQRRRARRRVSG